MFRRSSSGNSRFGNPSETSLKSKVSFDKKERDTPTKVSSHTSSLDGSASRVASTRVKQSLKEKYAKSTSRKRSASTAQKQSVRPKTTSPKKSAPMSLPIIQTLKKMQSTVSQLESLAKMRSSTDSLDGKVRLKDDDGMEDEVQNLIMSAMRLKEELDRAHVSFAYVEPRHLFGNERDEEITDDEYDTNDDECWSVVEEDISPRPTRRRRSNHEFSIPVFNKSNKATAIFLSPPKSTARSLFPTTCTPGKSSVISPFAGRRPKYLRTSPWTCKSHPVNAVSPTIPSQINSENSVATQKLDGSYAATPADSNLDNTETSFLEAETSFDSTAVTSERIEDIHQHIEDDSYEGNVDLTRYKSKGSKSNSIHGPCGKTLRSESFISEVEDDTETESLSSSSEVSDNLFDHDNGFTGGSNNDRNIPTPLSPIERIKSNPQSPMEKPPLSPITNRDDCFDYPSFPKQFPVHDSPTKSIQCDIEREMVNKMKLCHTDSCISASEDESYSMSSSFLSKKQNTFRNDLSFDASYNDDMHSSFNNNSKCDTFEYSDSGASVISLVSSTDAPNNSQRVQLDQLLPNVSELESTPSWEFPSDMSCPDLDFGVKKKPHFDTVDRSCYFVEEDEENATSSSDEDSPSKILGSLSINLQNKTHSVIGQDRNDPRTGSFHSGCNGDDSSTEDNVQTHSTPAAVIFNRRRRERARKLVSSYLSGEAVNISLSSKSQETSRDADDNDDSLCGPSLDQFLNKKDGELLNIGVEKDVWSWNRHNILPRKAFLSDEISVMSSKSRPMFRSLSCGSSPSHLSSEDGKYDLGKEDSIEVSTPAIKTNNVGASALKSVNLIADTITPKIGNLSLKQCNNGINVKTPHQQVCNERQLKGNTFIENGNVKSQVKSKLTPQRQQPRHRQNKIPFGPSPPLRRKMIRIRRRRRRLVATHYLQSIINKNKREYEEGLDAGSDPKNKISQKLKSQLITTEKQIKSRERASSVSETQSPAKPGNHMPFTDLDTGSRYYLKDDWKISLELVDDTYSVVIHCNQVNDVKGADEWMRIVKTPSSTEAQITIDGQYQSIRLDDAYNNDAEAKLELDLSPAVSKAMDIVKSEPKSSNDRGVEVRWYGVVFESTVDDVDSEKRSGFLQSLNQLVYGCKRNSYVTSSLRFNTKTLFFDRSGKEFTRTYEGGFCVYLASLFTATTMFLESRGAMDEHMIAVLSMIIIPPLITMAEIFSPHDRDEVTLSMVIVGLGLLFSVRAKAVINEDTLSIAS